MNSAGNVLDVTDRPSKQKGPEEFDANDFRLRIARYSKDNFPNILKIADGLKLIGERHSATAGQVALAWLLAQGDDVIPIPGTTRVKVQSIQACCSYRDIISFFVMPVINRKHRRTQSQVNS